MKPRSVKYKMLTGFFSLEMINPLLALKNICWRAKEY